jgi:hypothetical protein
MGAWMDIHGESIYFTRKSPMPNPLDGVYTTVNPAKGKLYVHLIDYSDSTLLIPLIGRDVAGVTELANGKNVPVRKTGDGIIMDLSSIQRNDINTVIVIDYDAKGGVIANKIEMVN